MRAPTILYLGICIVLISCTGGEYFDGDDIFTELFEDIADDQYDNKTYFTPPEWIIGTWYADNTEYWRKVQFTKTDVIHYNFVQYRGWEASSSNKILNHIMWGKYQWLQIEEKATDTSYFYSKMKNDHRKSTYNTLYRKVSRDSIIYVLSGDNNETRKYGRK